MYLLMENPKYSHAWHVFSVFQPHTLGGPRSSWEVIGMVTDPLPASQCFCYTLFHIHRLMSSFSDWYCFSSSYTGIFLQ